MRKWIFIFVALIFAMTPRSAQAYLEDYNALLKKYVKPVEKNGIQYNGVDYDSWSMDRRHMKVRQSIQKTDPEKLKADEDKLAFWINAYNFFTIDLIIQKGERGSIKDLSGAKSVWERYQWKVGKKIYTLGDIKNNLLQEIDNSKIHFTLSCAAKFCADLRSEVYDPDRVTIQLKDQLHLMMKNKTKGYERIKGQNVVRVSKITDRFENDDDHRKLHRWLKSYFPNHINGQTKIAFFKEDWSLNAQ